MTPLAATLPAHTSLLTGVYPLEHGILGNLTRGGKRFEPRPGLQPFAGFARKQGMRTAAFVSATPLKPHSGIQAGFDVFNAPAARQRTAEGTNAAVFAWLSGLDDDPFFLWVHYFDPHHPYEAPAAFNVFETDARLEAHVAERGITRVATRPNQDRLDSRTAINGYDGEILYVDHQIERLIGRLRKAGLWDELAVILTSDHGEGLGEHGMIGHGYVHREQLQVPLIMRVPGQPAQRVTAPISLVDVLPTFLGLLGGDDFGDFVAQASGIDVLADRSGNQNLLSQRSARERPDVTGPSYGLTAKGWRYIHEPEGRNRLFDWSTDPHEQHDLSSREDTRVHELRSELLQRVGSQVARGRALGETAEGDAKALDPATIEELRALGYID
jgi:arylsulfatase A-like enzyme